MKRFLAIICFFSAVGFAAGSTGRMQVGMNLESIADWSPAWTFTDVFQASRGWITHGRNTANGQETWDVGQTNPVAVDANGNVASLATFSSNGQTLRQVAATLMFRELQGAYPGGAYRAEWEGTGRVGFGFDAQVASSGRTPGGINFANLNVTPGNGGIYMRIEETDPAAPVRNFHVWMPDWRGRSFAGQRWQQGAAFSPFHPLFLERLAPFSVIRFMMAQETNTTDIRTWSDRRDALDIRQNSGSGGSWSEPMANGMSIEYMVRLANELDADPWFNMPHMADDGFVRNFATYVRDNLEPERKAYVEWSNEIWNSAPGFEATQWVQAQMQLPENAGLTQWQIAGREAKRDMDIWSEVFSGQTWRIERVAGGFSANDWVTARILDAMQGAFDAIAIAPYFSPSGTQRNSYTAATTVEQVLTDSRAGIDAAVQQVAAHRMLANARSAALNRPIRLLAYEGGAHLDSSSATYRNVFYEAANDARMGDLYREYLRRIDAAGLDLYVDFYFTGRAIASSHGDFAKFHRMDEPLAAAHRYRAVVAAADGSLWDSASGARTFVAWCSNHSITNLPARDGDKDGIPNLLEYATRRHPASPEAEPLLAVEVLQPNPVVQFGYNNEATDLELEIHFCPALETGPWQRLAAKSSNGSWSSSVTEVTVDELPGGRIDITDKRLVGNRGFYRLGAALLSGDPNPTPTPTPTPVPGGKDPATANVSTAFLGDIVSLNLDTWQTFNGTNRSYATVFGRYNNPDLSLSANTVEGEGRDPGSSADGVWANTPRFSTIGTFYWAMRVSFGWGNDFWFDAPRPGWSALALERPGAATLTVEVSPLNNPSSITATNTSASQIDLSWSRGVSGAPKDTLIVRSADPNFTAPAHGTAYSAGNSLGGDTVVYRGNGTSFSDPGLSAGTTYHYRLYAENWSYYSSGANASATTTLTPEPTPTPTPAPASVTRNVTYATVGGRALQLDAYRPAGTGPFPSIVLVHGGGFTSGSKGSGYIADLAVAVQAAGYAAFDINYRLQGDLGAGATVSDAMNAAQDDLKRALDFVVANAGTYGVDTNRLGVGGGSAGAITALLTTYGPNRSTVRPRALVDLWGSMYGNESSIRAGDPPLVIIHGTSDPTVSYSYATALNNAAVSAGVPVAFIPLPYSGHTFSISTVVNGQTIQQHVLNFLDQYLR